MSIHGASLSGQRIALLKTAPGGFLCAAIHGASLSGQRIALLKTAPGGFLCAAIHGASLSGQRIALLKTAPGGFLFRPVGKTLSQFVDIKAADLGRQFGEQIKVRQIDRQKTGRTTIHRFKR